MGAISCLWGIWGIISSVLNISWLTSRPILWATWLANSILLAALGLILGIGVMKSFIKNPQAQAKMDQTLAKLSPKQGMLGLVAIGVGAWMIASGFLFSMS